MYDVLEGLNVLEASSFVASPTAGLYLAQMGAEVIRVDQIGGGPDFHRWPVTEDNTSLYWENLNRGKRSVALDLSRDEGRELLVELTRQIGQFITNFPADGFLAHSKLSKGHPELITVRVMGWPDGSPALDYTVNNAVGYPLLTGEGPGPVNHVLPAWDLLTGAYAAFAMLAAVRHRDASGVGTEVRIPLSDVAVGTVSNLGGLAEVFHSGENRQRLGNAVYGLFGRDFVTGDGVRTMLVVVTPRQWKQVQEVLEISDAISAIESQLGVSFATDDGLRFTHRDKLFPVFEAAFSGWQHASLAAALDDCGIVHSIYQSTLEASRDPRLVTENPIFAETKGNPSGLTYLAAGPFATLPGFERGNPCLAPRNGQDSEDVLFRHLGLTSGQIGRLVDAGIVGVAK